MKLDRKLIKSQAKALIKNKIMKLFITCLVVVLCTSAIPIVNYIITYQNNPSGINNIFEDYGDYFENFDDDFNLYGFGNDYDDYENDDDDYYNQYEDDFENFGTENNSGKSDFYNFGTSFTPASAKTVIESDSANTLSVNPLLSMGYTYLTIIIQILLIPLAIALTYYFVLFIRGREFSGTDGLSFIFKEAFTRNYGKKIAVHLLREIIMLGLFFVCFLPLSFGILFIGLGASMAGGSEAVIIPAMCISLVITLIPPAIFYYSSYFAFQILCDNPQLSAWEAIKISQKMVKGNRSELFMLDLSFIPWQLLCAFIFPAIYVLPYVYTTQALYYENFRIRAMQMGKISENDFMTDFERMQKYANAGTYQANPNQQQGYAQASPSANQYANDAGYYTPQQNNGNACTAPQQNDTQPAQSSQPMNNTAPQQNNVYTAPQENVYTEPAAEQPTAPIAEPAENEKTDTEASMQASEVKPSEKYTPAAPPTENHSNSDSSPEE